MKGVYDNFNEGMKWRQRLAEKATYKALDIPESEGIGVTVNRNITRGMGWRELGVIGAIVLGGAMLLKTEAEVSPAIPSTPVDSEYEVRFYDQDGNRLPIEYRPNQ